MKFQWQCESCKRLIETRLMRTLCPCCNGKLKRIKKDNGKQKNVN